MANALAAEQTIDVFETVRGEKDARCRDYDDPQFPTKVDYVSCTPTFNEADPFARPFVHSYAASLLAAAAVNLGVRAFSRDRVAKYVLAGVVSLYPIILVHNARVLHAEATFKI